MYTYLVFTSMVAPKKVRKSEEITSESFENLEEAFLLKLLDQTANKLKEKFNYTNEDIQELFQKDELLIPTSIFSEKLSPAEALTKYLRENCKLRFVDISKALGRDERAVWGNYHRALKKMKEAFTIKPGVTIPISAFSDHKLTVFESVVVYLKDVKKMRGSEIAKLLGKEPANVWAVYKRALKKKK